MSQVRLLPRLSPLGLSLILDASGDASPSRDVARALLSSHSSVMSFAASGGTPSHDLAEQVEMQLRSAAHAAGFPDNSSQVARARFDRAAAKSLGEIEDLRTGEALRDDVWAYIAAVLLPDVVSWRFPERRNHRFAGGVRNAFQRLWMRASVLDRGPGHPQRWDLLDALSEDAAVQIFERASLGGSPPLARAIAGAWLKCMNAVGRPAMEDVMRSAIKLIRLRNEIIDLGSLPESDLEAILDEIFSVAVSSTR